MIPDLRHLFLIALSASCLFAQTGKHTARVELQILTSEEVGKGCGEFFFLDKTHDTEEKLVLGTSSKNPNELAIHVNGKFHSLKLDHESSPTNALLRQGKVGDRFIRTYSDGQASVRISIQYDSDLGEGFSFFGKLVVTTSGSSKSFRITGWGGC